MPRQPKIDTPWLTRSEALRFLNDGLEKQHRLTRRAFDKICDEGDGPPGDRDRYHRGELTRWKKELDIDRLLTKRKATRSNIVRQYYRLKRFTIAPTVESRFSIVEFMMAPAETRRHWRSDLWHRYMEAEERGSDEPYLSVGQEVSFIPRCYTITEAAQYARYKANAFRTLIRRPPKLVIQPDGTVREDDLNNWICGERLSIRKAFEGMWKARRRSSRKTISFRVPNPSYDEKKAMAEARQRLKTGNPGSEEQDDSENEPFLLAKYPAAEFLYDDALSLPDEIRHLIRFILSDDSTIVPNEKAFETRLRAVAIQRLKDAYANEAKQRWQERTGRPLEEADSDPLLQKEIESSNRKWSRRGLKPGQKAALAKEVEKLYTEREIGRAALLDRLERNWAIQDSHSQPELPKNEFDLDDIGMNERRRIFYGDTTEGAFRERHKARYESWQPLRVFEDRDVGIVQEKLEKLLEMLKSQPTHR